MLTLDLTFGQPFGFTGSVGSTVGGPVTPFTNPGPVPTFTSDPVPPFIATPVPPFTTNPVPPLTVLPPPTIITQPGITQPVVLPPVVTNPTFGPTGFIGPVPGVTLIGGPGDDTLLGGPAPDFIDGRGGNDLLVGGLANDTIVGGPGQDILTGNGGADLFLFAPGDGHDVVTDFNPFEGDHLALPFGSASSVTTDAVGNAVIAWSPTDSVTLAGVSPVLVNPSWFV